MGWKSAICDAHKKKVGLELLCAQEIQSVGDKMR